MQSSLDIYSHFKPQAKFPLPVTVHSDPADLDPVPRCTQALGSSA